MHSRARMGSAVLGAMLLADAFVCQFAMGEPAMSQAAMSEAAAGQRAVSQVGRAEPLPVARFIGNADYESAKLSPGGKSLALTQRTPEHEMITIVPINDMKSGKSLHFGNLIDIERYDWITEKQILVSPARRFPGYTTYKVPTGEIVSLDVVAPRSELVFGFQAGEVQTGTKIGVRQSVESAASLVDVLPGDGKYVVIGTEGYGIKGEYNEALRMNIYDGRTTRLARSPLRNGTFLTDLEHRVTIVYGEDEQGNNKVFYRERGEGEWQLVYSDADQPGVLTPVAAAPNGEYYALDSTDAPTRGVVLWDPKSGKRRLLFRNPTVDLSDVMMDRTGKVWAFRFVDHFPDYWYPNPDDPIARLHVALRKQFSGNDVWIYSATDDESLAVARIESSRVPATYLVVDVKTQKATMSLASRPSLKYEDLADVDPIEFAARDGLKIRGYLTARNLHAARKLPMIVMVHGGPYGIWDDWGFNEEAQLFASRGYAVMQVNYRGSGGRGLDFLEAGYHQWGARMQDDITDAVRWAISDGVADPKRICIYGGSYGAYAALEGVVREPDLFRCAVGMSGVYDLPMMFERGDIQTVERGEHWLKNALGTDVEEQKARSPVYHADQIKVPVLLIHGVLDKRAPIEHGRRMRDALEKAGKSVEWISESGEAHGVFGDQEREETYERMLAFFGRNLQ